MFLHQIPPGPYLSSWQEFPTSHLRATLIFLGIVLDSRAQAAHSDHHHVSPWSSSIEQFLSGDAPPRPEAGEFWKQGQAGGRPACRWSANNPLSDLALCILQEGGLQMSPSPQTFPSKSCPSPGRPTSSPHLFPGSQNHSLPCPIHKWGLFRVASEVLINSLPCRY